MTLLHVHDLRKAFGGVRAVDGISFSVQSGETVAFIGPNGAGKTTCFAMLGGQLKPDGGGIRLNGEDVAGQSPMALWRRGVGRTFQVASEFASMTVRENVQMALLSRYRRLWRFWAPARRRYVDEADSLLAKVGLATVADRAAGVLAYGDVKRLELAVALARGPRLLLMDEPTAGVAGGERMALMDLIAGLVGEGGLSVLFTEHDMDVVFGHADRVIVLHEGRLVMTGAPEQVRADAKVREIYLGSIGAGSGEERGEGGQ